MLLIDNFGDTNYILFHHLSGTSLAISVFLPWWNILHFLNYVVMYGLSEQQATQWSFMFSLFYFMFLAIIIHDKNTMDWWSI
jgi:hypothetical protein